jgi:hypothetical protein
LSISSTGVSTGCLSSNYLSATDSVRTAVAGTVVSDRVLAHELNHHYRHHNCPHTSYHQLELNAQIKIKD